MKKHANLSHWKKGQSGNPSGRPKDPFRELIREKTNGGKALVEKALSLLKSEDEDIQLKAVHYLSDRGWGKASQPVEHSGEVGILDLITGNSVGTNE